MHAAQEEARLTPREMYAVEAFIVHLERLTGAREQCGGRGGIDRYFLQTFETEQHRVELGGWRPRKQFQNIHLMRAKVRSRDRFLPQYTVRMSMQKTRGECKSMSW